MAAAEGPLHLPVQHAPPLLMPLADNASLGFRVNSYTAIIAHMYGSMWSLSAAGGLSSSTQARKVFIRACRSACQCSNVERPCAATDLKILA